MRPAPSRPVTWGGLSGGLDSGTVALAAAGLSRRPPRTYGLIMPGHTGAEQRLRRDELIAMTGASDTALDAQAYAPFCQGARRQDDAMVPWGEYYHEAFQALLMRAHGDGCDTILTGIGGDEISTPQWGEYEGEGEATREQSPPDFLTSSAVEACRETARALDPAPRGIAEQRYYEAAMAGSAVYLRTGVWPLYPYATPELVEFCRCLPADWRRGRALQRRWLERRGVSRRTRHPELPESFVPLLDFAMREGGRPLVTDLFSESRLAEQGLVSREALLASYERYRTANSLLIIKESPLNPGAFERTSRTLRLGRDGRELIEVMPG
jgi:asparagine synthase (glutamine-hydrolysing)